MHSVILTVSQATLLGLLVHYVIYYIWGIPLWTDAIAQWVMARTPNQYALWLLEYLGAWAKPFAMTAGLAVLGLAVTVPALTWLWLAPVFAVLFGWWFGYTSIAGQISFWVPALGFLLYARRGRQAPPYLSAERPLTRRNAIAMATGAVAVAAESYIRDERAARNAQSPQPVADFHPPQDTFAPGLVRKNVTPTAEFYGMSKNTVDPTPDPRTWRLKLSIDGKAIRELSYADVLRLPRISGYSTMRCVSNTLKSDLMGTALWTGVRLAQLVDSASLPRDIAEVAVVGVDGHGDSLPPGFAFSDGTLLALGMNGMSLDRTHGFPLRLIVPRYYGFKNVKWIGEIAFVTRPYFGTWPKMGYTKEPAVHTGCYVDRVVRSENVIRAGGIAFAGERGIRAVQVRVDNGPWTDVTLEQPLSPLTWRRWIAEIPAVQARQLEARAMDGNGKWQAEVESPLFPDGVKGPTIRKVS